MDYKDVDFRPLRDPNPSWEQETGINAIRAKMMTACFIYYDFDTPTVVRFIGGPHIGAHRRDTKAILKELKGKATDKAWHDLEWLYTRGAPHHCNAEATEDNFMAYFLYGNHKSAYTDLPTTWKSLVKDFKSSYSLCTDERIIVFLLHAHCTPLGMVNVLHHYKKARPVFDSTHHPYPWCFAINDWTSKYNEPTLEFPEKFLEYLIWIWNLRITYILLELYLAGDDMGGAFRNGKWNPFLVAMHLLHFAGLLHILTSLTFGDTTSPPNFEAIPVCRSQYAQWVWVNIANVFMLVAHWLPSLKFAADPTPAEQASFVQANRDELNQGVLDSNGSRMPPKFGHHVDDCMYADIKEYMPQTVGSSVFSLYRLLGEPQQHLPNPLSRIKFENKFSHQRRICGRMIDSRRLTVSLTPERREILVNELQTWLTKKRFVLLEAASLCGLLSDAAQINRWAWPLFYQLRNTLSEVIRARHHQGIAIP
jgi:hypothetical protein